ncbi:hypothetical protein [Streptomyces sp. NPDC002328]|uniref:hypothetical protein n=1 Tax=Streptomyces sp. NPDC002328 TaxID=3364642 RepID=UPI00368AB101
MATVPDEGSFGGRGRARAGRSPGAGGFAALRLDELLEGLQQQVQQVRAARDRMRTLLDGVLIVGSDRAACPRSNPSTTRWTRTPWPAAARCGS